jgi:crossover junction endodeoxyribonuclease RuvC
MILGIDPGLSGGWALLNSDGVFFAADDLPIVRDGKTAWVDAPELAQQIKNATGGNRSLWACGITAFVERVHSMPKQGVSSSFTFGTGFGSVLATVQMLPASLELVTPAVWKRDLGLSKDKNASLDKARLLYPQANLKRSRDDGRAEALLIARWGYWKHFNGRP